MQRTFFLAFLQICAVSSCLADFVRLKDGGQISGLVESGTQTEIQIKVGDNSLAIAVDAIESIQFDAGQPAPLLTSATVPDAGPPPVAQSITIPAGTDIAIRTIDRIDSKTADLSKEYAASLDDPIMVDGAQVVPANANAFLRVTDLQHKKIRGRDSLSITLVAVVVNGQRFKVESSKIDSQSGSPAKRTATGALAGGAAGAAIGAIAGGGVGAAVGALAGGGVGAVAGNVMGRKPVEIAPETRFTYKVTQAVVIGSQEAAR